MDVGCECSAATAVRSSDREQKVAEMLALTVEEAVANCRCPAVSVCCAVFGANEFSGCATREWPPLSTRLPRVSRLQPDLPSRFPPHPNNKTIWRHCEEDQPVSWTVVTRDTLLRHTVDAPGPTFFSYTPNGKQLITAGLNGAVRIFDHGSDDEPAIIDVTTENHLAVVASNDFFIIGAETGEVTKYNLITKRMDEVLVRCTAPVRDLALSPDGQWVAVASE